MRSILLLATAVTALVVTFPARALTGEELLEGLRAADSPNEKYSFQAGLAIGFVSGASNVAVSAGVACPTTKVSTQQMIAIAKKHIENTPEKWQESADSLVIRALQVAFPCTQRSGG